jgi:hypothetical protein
MFPLMIAYKMQGLNQKNGSYRGMDTKRARF